MSSISQTPQKQILVKDSSGETAVYWCVTTVILKYYIGGSFGRRFKEHLPTCNLISVKSNYAAHFIDFDDK